MKKFFSIIALAALTALGFTSCSDDDEVPILEPVTTSEGVFVVNGGNKGGGIDGSLSYYDYATEKVSHKVYEAANHASLGGTVNDAIVYGSKIYIIGTDESTIFVADKTTLKKVANIKSEVKGETAKPRRAAAGYGFVFVTTYSNAVLAIDTLTNTIANTYPCGNYTEGIAIRNGVLYTADSNYGTGEGASISIINVNKTKTESYTKTQTFTHELIKNPTDVIIENEHCYILDAGTYDANWNQRDQGVYEITGGSIKKIMEATEMAVANGKIYAINAPYTYPATAPTYTVYDMSTGIVSTFTKGEEIAYPGKISVDPINGNVYITSYNLKSTGSADYKAESYCTIYTADGTYKGRFACNVGAGKVVANTNTQYVQK